LLTGLIKQQQQSFFVGNAQPFLDLSAIKRLKIAYPSSSEQKKIADFLSTLDEQIETVTAQIDHMKTWKRGLLQKMFV